MEKFTVAIAFKTFNPEQFQGGLSTNPLTEYAEVMEFCILILIILSMSVTAYITTSP